MREPAPDSRMKEDGKQMPAADARERTRPEARGNLEMSSLRVNAPVCAVSVTVILAFIALALLFQEKAAEHLAALRDFTTTRFDWLLMISCNVCLLFCLFLVFSPLGRVRLGGPAARPRYSRATWFAMIYASGIAIGLLFYGVMEPVYYFQNPPLGIDPSDTSAAFAAGIAGTIFHWGLHGWSTYALMGLAIALLAYNRGMPFAPRSVLYPVIGDRAWGWTGHVVDTLAVFATLFGLATSLGLGAGQVAAGLNYLTGIPATQTTKVVFIIVITGVVMVSVMTGLDVGIKRMSQFNIVLAMVLLVFVVATGPTEFQFRSVLTGISDYARKIVPLSNWIGREDKDFLHGWTTFYWAWWFSWMPFIGVFIARISRGRTVREFLLTVIFLPTLLCAVWMSVFGGTALHQFLFDGYTGVTDAVRTWNLELALFRMLQHLPLTETVSLFCLVLLAIFFTTSSDSGSLVADVMAAGGRFDTKPFQRAFWCTLEGSIAIALLLGGGLKSLQAAAMITGLPFSVLIVVTIVSVWKVLGGEYRRLPDG